MKKIFLLIITLILIPKVYALEKKDYTFNRENFLINYEDKLVYCINICKDKTFTNMQPTTISLTKLDKIKEYIYFGYNYNSQNDIKYYYATQNLIWKALYNYDISWYENNSLIDLSDEQNVIEQNISKYYLKPSFAEKTIIGEYKTINEIIDDNGVLNYFTENDDNIEIINDKLVINFSWLNSKNITLVKKIGVNETKFYKDNNNEYIYSNGINSLITSFSLKSKISKVNFKINVSGKKYVNNKFVESEIDNTYELYAKEDIYDIYNKLLYLKDTLIMEIQSNTDTIINVGNYYIKEKSSLSGYKNDQNVYNVELLEDSQISIIKELLVSNVTFETDETNNIYEIYNDNLILELSGNEKINIDLPYGIYLMKSNNITKQFELKDNSYHLLILESDEFVIQSITEKELKNEVAEIMPNTIDNLKIIEFTILILIGVGVILLKHEK